MQQHSDTPVSNRSSSTKCNKSIELSLKNKMRLTSSSPRSVLIIFSDSTTYIDEAEWWLILRGD